MREIVWQVTDTETVRDAIPSDAAAARGRLERGSEGFAALFDLEAPPSRRVVQLTPGELGVSATGEAPDQRPFAIVLSCADARVPVEMLLSQRANDLFVVRVAGGVLGESAMGSLDYAVAQLPTVQLALVLGHTGCGAVTAAVDTYLRPDTYVAMGDSRPLLALVHNLLGPVRLAAHTLEEVHGSDVVSREHYREALIEMAVVANAGVIAAAIGARNTRRAGVVGRRVDTGFAVYDLVSRRIGLPGSVSSWIPGIADAPVDHDAFSHWLREVAFGPRVSALLESTRAS